MLPIHNYLSGFVCVLENTPIVFRLALNTGVTDQNSGSPDAHSTFGAPWFILNISFKDKS